MPDSQLSCRSCGADWRTGAFDPECEECGGGAMERACCACDGCGAVWTRAVLDSHDAGVGQWVGHCQRSFGADAD